MMSRDLEEPPRIERAIPAVAVAESSKSKDILSLTSDGSPDSGSDSDRKSGGAVASEEVRRRRKTCLMVFAFLPFVAASLALGVFVMGRRDGDAARLEDGGDSSSSATPDAGEVGEVGSVPSASYTATTAAPASAPPTESPVVETGRPSPSPAAGKQQGEASSAAVVHGNLRSTSSPTAASPTTASPTTASPTTASPTTASPTTASPTTASPTTASPTTASPTTASPTSTSPTVTYIATAPPTMPEVTTSSPTTPQLIELAESTRLGLCQGDCDRDDDCQGTLNCFQRDASEAVPGCGGEGALATDYCYNGPSIPIALTDVGSFNNNEVLKECRGDCDDDDDCEGSLVCFQRDGLESIPGCSGDGTKGTDYCTARPSIDYLYSPVDTSSFEFCEGDCDSDNDCEDSLVCFQRSGFDSVPGCLGKGSAGTDYCIDRPADYLYAPSGKSTFGLCEGDCDSDDDCVGSLACFLRSKTESVPGCSGNGAFGVDYCYDSSINYLYTSERLPLPLCAGDCDSDNDCEGDLICEQRSGLTEISGCIGTGVKDSDYCRLAPVSATLALRTSSPSTAPTSLCVKAGELCPEDKKLCCSGKCEKNKETGEKVCEVEWESELAQHNLRATTSPTVAPTSSCVRPGDLCPQDKNLCCSSHCERDHETGLKVCGPEWEEHSFEIDVKPADRCFAAGEPCMDKNLCCSGWCMKAVAMKDEKREQDKRKEDKNEVCGW